MECLWVFEMAEPYRLELGDLVRLTSFVHHQRLAGARMGQATEDHLLHG